MTMEETQMIDGFDLRALVREVCSTSTIADPATIAKEVARRIGRNQQATALDQALPVVVQHVISRGRSAVIPQQRAAPTSNRSRKVASIRETWRRMLRDRIAVGPAVSDWKFLGDCNADDLAYAAAIREDHARRNAARAEQLRQLADLLAEHRVDTVAQLPEPVLSASLEEAA
jgi:hypothetical protein